MQSTRPILLAMIAALAPAGGRAECTRAIVTGDAEYEPLSWYDGTAMRGAAEDMVGAALKRIGLEAEFRYMGPFKRVLAAAEAGEVDLVAELKRTPEREAFLEFSKTPLFANPVAVFTHRPRSLTLVGWQDLIGLHGSMVLGNRFGGGFDEFLRDRLSVEELPQVETGFKMLAADRVDFFVTSYFPGRSYLMEHGQDVDFTIQKPFVTETQNYVGISKAGACRARLAALEGALAAMAKEGEILRIYEGAVTRWRLKAGSG